MSVAVPTNQPIHKAGYPQNPIECKTYSTSFPNADMTTEDSLQADAFQRIYPEQYYARFIHDGIRPDGRPLGRARATTFGLKAVSTSEGSALVKIGNTTAIAAVKLQILRAEQAHIQGQLAVSVEMTPLCSADVRLGRPNHEAQSIQNRLSQLFLGGDLLDMNQLQLLAGKAAWSIDVIVYVLDADGCVFDAVLLSTTAALRDLTLPSITLSEEGKVSRGQSQSGNSVAPQKLVFKRLPISLTLGIYKEHIIADPSSEEEALMSAFINIIVDQHGHLLGVFKPGGAAVPPKVIHTCIEAAKLRQQEVMELLEQSLTAAAMDTS